jgi:hypothetical protein
MTTAILFIYFVRLGHALSLHVEFYDIVSVPIGLAVTILSLWNDNSIGSIRGPKRRPPGSSNMAGCGSTRHSYVESMHERPVGTFPVIAAYEVRVGGLEGWRVQATPEVVACGVKEFVWTVRVEKRRSHTTTHQIRLATGNE